MMDIFVNNVQFSFKSNTLLFPLDVQGFLLKLEPLGYNPVQKGSITKDGLPAQVGDIAMKDNTFVNINVSTQTIAFSSTKTEEIIEMFEELKPLIKLMGLDIDKDIRAYSIVGEYLVETTNNAMEKLKKFIGSSPATDSIDVIFGTDSHPTSMVLLPKNTSLLNEDYYQIKIEPSIQRLGKTYFIQYSQRSRDYKHLLKFLSEMPMTIEKAIQKIES